MRQRIRRILIRARYAAVGAAVGAGIGGLISRNAASTGGAVGGLVGAMIGETRIGADALIDRVQDRRREIPISEQ